MTTNPQWAGHPCPHQWVGPGRCRRCVALAQAATELDQIETEVAGW